jgi:hypothetical protein
MTAWSFLYDEMYGSEDEQYIYTVTGEKWVAANGVTIGLQCQQLVPLIISF